MYYRTYEQTQILAAGVKGGEGALFLALQLADAMPCKSCGYVHYHCKCDNTKLNGFILGEN